MRFNRNIFIILICFGCTLFRVLARSCEDAYELPDLDRRARNYEASGDIGNDPYVNDISLTPGWYKVGNYRIPDSNYIPNLYSCGTVFPVYIKGNHASVDVPRFDHANMTACEQSLPYNCSYEINIQVRKCQDEIQYYLIQTGYAAAYCLDPPEIQNVKEFESPPQVQLGTLSVKPHLRFRVMAYSKMSVHEPYLEFECLESPTTDILDQGFFFSTYWFVNSNLIKTCDRQSILECFLTEDDIMKKGYKLGIRIRCGIRSSSSKSGLQTEMVSSTDFFAGVKVSETVIQMAKDETATITLQPTVPYGCYAKVDNKPTFSCQLQIIVHIPELTTKQCVIDRTHYNSLPSIVQHQAQCGALIKGFFPYQTQNNSSPSMKAVMMNITSPFLSVSDQTDYRLALKTVNNKRHSIWMNLLLAEIQLHIVNNQNFKQRICYSHVDPHMQTFKGSTYDINAFGGDFILYWHKKYDIQVQMRTTRCNGDRAYCACAVAVRAGGDVFLINICGGLRDVGMNACKDGGALVIQQDDEYNYQVLTNIGTLVKIKILTGDYNNLMNIDVHLAPKDVGMTGGLCGIFDGTRDSEFRSRSFIKMSKSDFIKEWMITFSRDLNFLDKTCHERINRWQESGHALYCTCNCTEENLCDNLKTEVVCSPTQYVNCSVSFSKASQFCEYYYEDCQIDRNGKRSVSHQNAEDEMRRRAGLSTLPHKVIVKRADNALDALSEETAREKCTDKINTEMVIQRAQLLNGLNLSRVIEECTWDIYTGQDLGWIQTHKEATDAAIDVGYKRDANYTLTHVEQLDEFKKQTCPNNCDGHGNCTTAGVCQCHDSFFGPDCAKNKSVGPVIEEITGGGFCDTRYSSECRCFFVQTDALINTFTCRGVKHKIMLNGETIRKETEIVSGRHRNIYNGDCCFTESREKRSLQKDDESHVLHYMYMVSLSNDGHNFGPAAVMNIFNSLCLKKNNDTLWNTSFDIKDGTCLILGKCYEKNAINLSNECYWCKPEISQLDWTYDCKPTESDNTALIIGIVVGVPASLLLILFLVIWLMKNSSSNKRAIAASQEFTPVVRDVTQTTKPYFNSRHLYRDFEF